MPVKSNGAIAERQERERKNTAYLGRILQEHNRGLEVAILAAKSSMGRKWKTLMELVVIECENNSKESVSRSLGVTRQTLDRWIKDYQKGNI